jgi:hypothetical protein
MLTYSTLGACRCISFHDNTKNCTQSSCSPQFIQPVLDLIAAPCQTVTAVLNTDAATSTSPSTATHTSPTTTITTAPLRVTVIGQTATYATLPPTTYINPDPSGTETVTVYGRPSPCPTSASKPSDCGPIINPSSKAVIEFDGAAGANYSVEVSLDNSITMTSMISSRSLLMSHKLTWSLDNALSISTIKANIDLPYLCTLITVDYPVTFVEGPPGTWAIGAPQIVTSISCGVRNTRRSTSEVLLNASEETFSNDTGSVLKSESYNVGEGLIASVLWSLGALSLVFLLM